MTVIPFPGPTGAWSQQERRALSDLQQHLAQVVLEPRLTTGVSDEGHAWAAIIDPIDERSLVHVARRGAGVVLILRDGPTVIGLALPSALPALISMSDSTSPKELLPTPASPTAAMALPLAWAMPLRTSKLAVAVLSEMVSCWRFSRGGSCEARRG